MQLLLLFYAVYVAAGGRYHRSSALVQLATSKKSLPYPVSETASRAVDRLDGETPLFHIKGKGGYLSNF
jgi:hypothetical protein